MEIAKPVIKHYRKKLVDAVRQWIEQYSEIGWLAFFLWMVRQPGRPSNTTAERMNELETRNRRLEEKVDRNDLTVAKLEEMMEAGKGYL